MNKGRASALPTKQNEIENTNETLRHNLRNTNGGIDSDSNTNDKILIAMELNYEIDVRHVEVATRPTGLSSTESDTTRTGAMRWSRSMDIR